MSAAVHPVHWILDRIAGLRILLTDKISFEPCPREMLRLIFVVVALAQVCVSLGYVHGLPKAYRSSSVVMSAADSNMRSLSQHVKKASTAFIVGCMISSSFSSASLAAVGEGDLPPGALAFSKILKYQVSGVPSRYFTA
jgi:hypothetical protein